MENRISCRSHAILTNNVNIDKQCKYVLVVRRIEFHVDHVQYRQTMSISCRSHAIVASFDHGIEGGRFSRFLDMRTSLECPFKGNVFNIEKIYIKSGLTNNRLL